MDDSGAGWIFFIVLLIFAVTLRDCSRNEIITSYMIVDSYETVSKTNCKYTLKAKYIAWEAHDKRKIIEPCGTYVVGDTLWLNLNNPKEETIGGTVDKWLDTLTPKKQNK